MDFVRFAIGSTHVSYSLVQNGYFDYHFRKFFSSEKLLFFLGFSSLKRFYWNPIFIFSKSFFVFSTCETNSQQNSNNDESLSLPIFNLVSNYDFSRNPGRVEKIFCFRLFFSLQMLFCLCLLINNSKNCINLLSKYLTSEFQMIRKWRWCATNGSWLLHRIYVAQPQIKNHPFMCHRDNLNSPKN